MKILKLSELTKELDKNSVLTIQISDEIFLKISPAEQLALASLVIEQTLKTAEIDETVINNIKANTNISKVALIPDINVSDNHDPCVPIEGEEKKHQKRFLTPNNQKDIVIKDTNYKIQESSPFHEQKTILLQFVESYVNSEFIENTFDISELQLVVPNLDLKKLCSILEEGGYEISFPDSGSIRICKRAGDPKDEEQWSGYSPQKLW